MSKSSSKIISLGGADKQERSGIKEHDLTYADLLVHYLEKQGVTHAFGIPGGAHEPLFNALQRSSQSQGVTPVLTKHEQGAAFMADGYARASGRLGVCCATSGPGATNMITGVSVAYMDSVPILVLTGQVPTKHMGKGAFQDSTHHGVHVVEMFRSICNYSDGVLNTSVADSYFRKAIQTAMTGRRGPSHLSLPFDILGTALDTSTLSRDLNTKAITPRYWDRQSIQEAATMLVGARHCAILAGTGCKQSGATEELIAIAEALFVPVATTPKGKGVFPEDHELSVGCFGFAGSPRASQCIIHEDIDVLLAVGTSFNEFATNAWAEGIKKGKKIIQIDIDPHQFERGIPCDIPITGDAKAALSELRFEISRRTNTTFTERAIKADLSRDFLRNYPRVENADAMQSDAVPLKPQRLIADIQSACPDNTMFFMDIGNHLAWAIHYLKLKRSQDFFAPLGFGSMGYGVPAAIGGKLASPDRPSVGIVGDGGFLMTGTEIATAVNHEIPVVWIIFNDAGLGMVRHGQAMSPNAAEVCSSFQRVDFVKMAKGLGAEAMRVTQPGTINADFMADIFASGKPTVLDVVIDAEEVPPIHARIESIGSSYE